MPQHLYTSPKGTTLKAPLKMFEQASKLPPAHKHQLGPNLRYPVAAVKTEGNYAIVTFGKNEDGSQVAFNGRNTWAFWAAAESPHAVIKRDDAGHIEAKGERAPRTGQLIEPGNFKIDNYALDLITHFEGFRESAYLCPSNVWTYGIGSITHATGRPVRQGDSITQAEAQALLMRDCESFIRVMNNVIELPRTPQEIGGILSFTYNCGGNALKESTLLKRINANASDEEVKYQLSRWDNGGIPGLVRRRKAEGLAWIEQDWRAVA